MGTGTTTLSGDNSYTNATLINAGTLLAASTNAFGSSVVTLTNSGSIALSTNLTISSLVWSGASSSVAISNLSSGAYLNITGALNLTGTGTFNLTGDTLGSSPLELMAWGSGSYTTNNFAITGQSGYVLSISNDALYIATAPVPSNILYVGSNSSSQTTNFTSGTNIYTGVYVGYSAAALSNKLVVSGNSTLLTNSGDTYIGYDGHNNSMVISNGGTVVNSNGWIGYGSTASNNIVTVNGGTWSNSGNLYVGLDGASNSLVITNGGTVQSAAVFVGHYATAVGNLLAVSGTQSTLNVSGDLYVGYAGQSNRMVISSGGFVSDVNGFDDGVSPSDSHNSVLVTGSGSVWTNSGNLTFGLAGHDNSLVISNSGFVAVGGESIIGNQSTASNNSVLVTGAGSLWTNSQDLTIGSDGSGNSLSILNGGSVSVLGNTNGVAIGLNADSSNNSVTVSGASTLTSGQNVYVGVYGSGNSLIVSNNAKVNLSNSGTLQLGYDSNSINNSVLVTSNGTINDYDVYLGSSTSGTNRQNNYLVVFRGGALNSGDEIDVYSGSILVTEGGVMSATNDINIGWGSSSSNSLVVSNTGVVNCSSFTVGSYATSSNNFVIVTGTNSKIINTGDFLMNYGNASVNNSMVISNGGVVSDVNATLYGNTNSSSYGTFDSVYIKGAGSAWSNSTLTIGGGGSAYVTVCDGATLAASNGITLNSTNGLDFLIIGDYTLASGTFNPIYNSNGTGGSIIAPSITFTNGVLGAPFEGAAIGFAQAGLCTLTSSVSGYGQIVQLGMGTSVISGNNGSFSGLTVIQSGTLQAASTNALGTSGVQLSGGTLSLATNLTINSLSWDTGAIVQLATNGVFLNVTNGVSLTGSGTNNFDFLGYFSSSSNSPTELMAFGSSSLSTTNFGIDDVTGYTLFTSNNALWVYGGTFNGGGGGGLIASNTGTTISITQTNASVTFQTNGILTITPTGNLTITTNVVVNNNGTVNLNGQFTTPNLTIQSGSTLSGNGGTLNGNLTLQKGSAFVVQSGQSPITVNGTATLGGTLEIATPMAFGTKQTFLSATSITGTFDSIIAPAGERARLVIEGDPTVSVIMAPVSYTQMAANQNQVNVATALNSFIPYTSSDRLVISTSLDSLTASQYNQAFNAIMPTFYQQVATIAFNEANALNMELNQRLWGLRLAEGGGFSMSGLAENYPMIQEGQGDGGKGVLDAKKDILRPGLDNHWGLFVDGNGIFSQANSANMLPGYNSESGGITTGLTYKWNDKVASGIYAGYQGTYTKSGANGSGLGTGSSLTDNAVRFGVFGTYGNKDGKGLYLNALAGGAYHNYQATRVIQYTGMNRTANSQPGAGELDSMLATGYDIQKGKFTFGPTASLQYTYLGVNSLNETGAQSLNYNSGGWNSSSMLSSMGAHAAYNWIAHHGSGGDIVVVPQINLNWQHEFMQNPYDISGNLGGTSPTFSNWSAAPIRDFLYTGVGFTVDIGKRWNTSFFYNAAAGNQNLTSQNIFWSAGVKF